MPNSYINVPITGGVNLLKDPRRIRDDQFVSTKNLVPVNPGILKTRPAVVLGDFVAYDQNGAVTPAISIPLSLFAVPYVDMDVDFVFATRSISSEIATHIHSTTFNGYPSGSVEIESLGGVTEFQPTFIAFNGRIYVFGGRGSTVQGKVLSMVSGASQWDDFTFDGSGNSGLQPAVAGAYRNRVVYGNLASGYESALLFSDEDSPGAVGNDALSANGYYFTVGENDGDRVVAIQEFSQTSVGSPMQAACLVLKQFSAYVITGMPGDSSGAFDIGDLTVNKVAFPCGCSSAQTMVDTPYGLIWAGPDDVWMFDEGQIPRRIGTNIRAALERTPAHLRYKWHAEYHDGFYRLAIFGEGQGADEDAPCQDQFWLDLRDGAPQNPDEARWWGPQQYKVTPPNYDEWTIEGTYNMAVSAKPDQERALFGLTVGKDTSDNYLYYAITFGGQNGYDGLGTLPNIAQIVTGEFMSEYTLGAAYTTADFVYNGLNAYMCVQNIAAATTAPTGYQYSDDGTGRWQYVGPADFCGNNDVGEGAIEVELRSKIYDFGDPMIRKIFQGAELDLRTNKVCRLSWEAVLDDGGGSAAETEDISAPGFETGLNEVDEDALSREFQSIRCSPDSSERPIGKLVQLVLRNVPGYTIVEGYNDTLVVGLSAVGGDPTSAGRACVIEPGVYDATDLIVAVAAAIEAAWPTFSISALREPMGAVRITCSGVGATIGLVGDGSLDSALGLTAGVSERTAALLGFQTGENYYNTSSRGIIGASELLFAPTPIWEIGGIMLKIRPIPRRP